MTVVCCCGRAKDMIYSVEGFHRSFVSYYYRVIIIILFFSPPPPLPTVLRRRPIFQKRFTHCNQVVMFRVSLYTYHRLSHLRAIRLSVYLYYNSYYKLMLLSCSIITFYCLSERDLSTDLQQMTFVLA